MFCIHPPKPKEEFLALAQEELTEESEAIIRELRSNLPSDSEAIAMLNDILKGSNLGPDDGVFPLAKVENRFDWIYVRRRYDKDSNGVLSASDMV